MDALDLAINKFKEAIKSLADQYSKAFGFKKKYNSCMWHQSAVTVNS